MAATRLWVALQSFNGGRYLVSHARMSHWIRHLKSNSRHMRREHRDTCFHSYRRTQLVVHNSPVDWMPAPVEPQRHRKLLVPWSRRQELKWRGRPQQFCRPSGQFFADLRQTQRSPWQKHSIRQHKSNRRRCHAFVPRENPCGTPQSSPSAALDMLKSSIQKEGTQWQPSW